MLDCKQAYINRPTSLQVRYKDEAVEIDLFVCYFRWYKRMTTRGNYGTEARQNAVAVISATMSFKKASVMYNIPRPILRQHRDAKVKHPGNVHFGAFEPVLSGEFESYLVLQIQMMQ